MWAVATATAFEASPAPLFLGAAGVLAGIAIAALAQSMRRRTLAADRM